MTKELKKNRENRGRLQESELKEVSRDHRVSSCLAQAIVDENDYSKLTTAGDDERLLFSVFVTCDSLSEPHPHDRENDIENSTSSLHTISHTSGRRRGWCQFSF